MLKYPDFPSFHSSLNYDFFKMKSNVECKNNNNNSNVDKMIMTEDPKGISPSQRVTVANLANLEMSCADTPQS